VGEEAVNNAISHGNCTRVNLVLQIDDAGLVLQVADDGDGCDPRSPEFPGLGLKLMEYRARLLGGAFRVEQIAGSGTRVIVTVPERSASHEALTSSSHIKAVR
jgi:two-component system sensor kinase FixL